jgi:hypothetical protein
MAVESSMEDYCDSSRSNFLRVDGVLILYVGAENCTRELLLEGRCF